MRTATAILAFVVVAAVAGVAAAQPTAPAGSGAGSALQPPVKIDIKPGQPVLQPVRPGQPGQPQPGAPPIVIRQPPGAGSAAVDQGSGAEWRPPNHGDIATGTGKDKPLLAIAFWLFALITLGGAVFVITRRNLIAAVMGMVGSFFGVAAVYMMLFASFLAVVQMLVYAGAIMVLFVFVIMILNKPEDEPFAGPIGIFGKGLAGAGLAYLAFRLVTLVWKVAVPATANPVPGALETKIGADPTPVLYPFGTTKAVGHTLFNGYLFPFEAVSILLLVAVVGAIAVARPLKDDEGIPPPEGAP